MRTTFTGIARVPAVSGPAVDRITRAVSPAGRSVSTRDVSGAWGEIDRFSAYIFCCYDT